VGVFNVIKWASEVAWRFSINKHYVVPLWNLML